MQSFKGHVVDEYGFEIEVWVEKEPDSGTPSHVFLMHENSQVGDFPFSQPHANDLVQIEADRVAAGVARKITVYPDAVIDIDDEGVAWH